MTIPVLLLSLTGCSLVPEYMRPSIDMPKSWEHAAPQAALPADTAFWKRFESEELAALVQRALAHNHDLAAARRRVAQARAAAKIAGAELWPDANTSASASRNVTEPANQPRDYGSSGRGALAVAYEIDLFGGNRASAAAARERAEASAFDREALALVVAAETARAYAATLALADRRAVARQNLENTREVLDIVAARHREGSASALELSQQRAALASAEASIAALERQYAASKNALAVLTGALPESLTLSGASLAQLSPPAVAPAQPSELLTRRPDIHSAEAQLIAAHADIGAARAAFFPSLTLGGDAAVTLSSLSSAGATVLGIGASLAAPIFQGGRLTGRLEQTQARRDELVENYRKAVLVAFQEVENALAATHSAGVRETALATAVTESETAYGIARERYDAGAIDFLTLLDTQRSLLQARDSAVQAKLERLEAAIDLYKALGGNWAAEAEARE